MLITHLKRAALAFTVLLLLVAPALAQDEAPAKTGFRPDAPPYGIRGPYSVGTRVFNVSYG